MKQMQRVEVFVFQNLIVYDRMMLMQDCKDARMLDWMHSILKCAYVHVCMYVCTSMLGEGVGN